MRLATVLAITLGAAFAAASYTTVRAQQAAARSANDGIYTAEQSTRGATVYAEMCAACHDAKLLGGMGPALAGKDFLPVWKDMTVGDFFSKIKNEMPLTAPGSLSPDQTADLVAFVLGSNQFPAGSTALPTDAASLKDIKIAEPNAAAGGGAAGGGGLYADAQAKRGETVYADLCAACHDPKLIGGIGPALAGTEFVGIWKSKSVGDLFAKIKNEMPMTAPGSLSPQQAADVLAFMLSANHYAAGAEMKTDLDALNALPLGEPPQK